MVVLGTYTNHTLMYGPTDLIAASSVPLSYVRHPAVLAYLEHHNLIRITRPTRQGRGSPHAAVDFREKHGLLLGPPGVGKSMAVSVIEAGLLAEGYSLVKMNPKLAELLATVHTCRTLGLKPEQIFLVSPSLPGAVPAWNILDQGLPVSQTASQLVDLLERASGSSNAPRRHDILVNAALLAASCGLSIAEMTFALSAPSPEYLLALLNLPIKHPDEFAWSQVAQFFLSEFLNWPKAERLDAVSVCTRAIREFLRSEFFYGLLCPRRTTMRFSDLWNKQTVLLFHLDQSALGQHGSVLLGGMCCGALFAAAMRQQGGRVLVSIDELPSIARLVGEEIEQILQIGRSQGLHLLLACQAIGALPERLRLLAMKYCSLQLQFRADFDDARMVATAALSGQDLPIAQLEVSFDHIDRETGQPTLSEWQQPILDPSGRKLQVARPVWEQLKDPLTSTISLKHLLSLVGSSGIKRLYVREPGTDRPIDLGRYIETFPPYAYFITGPSLMLHTVFPSPCATKIQHMSQSEAIATLSRVIQELPGQHALLRLAGKESGIVRIADVTTSSPSSEDHAYLAAVLSANGQTSEEIHHTAAWREEQMAILSAGHKMEHTGDAHEPTDESKW